MLAAGSLVCACTVGPNYVKPQAVTPASYKEARGWKKAAPAEENVPKGPWWELFNDPVLDSLENAVNISNQNIAAYEAQYREAVAAVRAARSGYYPQVGASPSYTRQRLAGAQSAQGISGTISDYQLPVSASWEPDLWGKVRRMVEASKASAQASFGELESVRLSAQATLAEDYYQLRTYDAQEKLLGDTVVAYKQFLELTKNLYASGVDSSADVLQAETQLLATQAQLIDVGVSRAQTEHAIALLAGQPASTFSIPAMPVAGPPPSIPVGVPSELLERRPDIAAAEREMASANAEIGVAEAAYFPTLSLTASGGFAGTSLANWLSWPNRVWAVGAAISETVFDGGLRGALTAEARATYDATVATYRQTVLTAFQEVEDQLAALRILEQEAAVEENTVTDARKLLDVTMNQYKAGTASYLNVISAQATVLTARTTLLQIVGRQMVASATLVTDLGGNWNDRGYDKDITGYNK